jgi:hypothetical protein
MLNRYFLIVIVAFLPLYIVSGQVTEKQRVIQVTGIISDEESNPVPGVSIISQKLRRGSISELTGIFNILSLPGDTIWLTALGYKNGSIVIPSHYEEKQYTKDITLSNDTIAIKDVVILPWKNYEEFKREVLADRPVKQELLNMYENLASIQQAINSTASYRSSPEAGFRMAMQQNANALYSKGQSPYNNLLNPFAWAKFFSGLKNGLLKNQKSTAQPSTKAKVKKKKSVKVE